jgi:hypothetical protein
MTQNFLQTLDVIRGKGYGGFFSSVFNVEGGQVGLADERMPACDECYGTYETTISCSACGRTPTNFFQFRSGDGDGVYAVMDLCHASEPPLGGLLLFDRGIVNGMLGMVEGGSPRLFDLDFADVMEEMEGICIGNITIEGDPNDEMNYCIYVGDSGADDSGRYALPYFHAVPGEYSIFLFGMREAALIIPRKRLKDFGLSEKHDWNKEEVRNFAIGSPDDLVNCHMNPAGVDAVAMNTELTYFEDGMPELIPGQAAAFISWIIQLHDIAPDRVPSQSLDFFNGAIPEDELQDVRVECAQLRGYVSPPLNTTPKKKSLFKK